MDKTNQIHCNQISAMTRQEDQQMDDKIGAASRAKQDHSGDSDASSKEQSILSASEIDM